MKKTVAYLAGFILASCLFFIPVRLAVTFVGLIVNATSGESFPLGSAWINWLCFGLAILVAFGSLVHRLYNREFA